uniref:Uncharacterized protein n=1 Tax=Anaerobacillus isosaccharinicus TaxID=1532552 RepID=A0A1S2LHW9_9BACI
MSDLKLPTALSAKGYLIGFSTAIMWSPYFGSVSLVLYYLQMSVGAYILYGIGLSLVSLVVGNILFGFWVVRNSLTIEKSTELPIEKKHKKQLFQLVLFVTILLAHH